MKASNLKPRLEELWRLPAIGEPDLQVGDDAPSWVCACGDEAGAVYYATRHNLSAEMSAPLLITFEAGLTEMIVDGRDFLFTLFQLGSPEKARIAAARLFGSAVLRYVDRAWQTEDQSQRIALCKLAVMFRREHEWSIRTKQCFRGFPRAFVDRLHVQAYRSLTRDRSSAGY